MTSHRFPHLAQRLFNVPLAILPQKAEVVMAALADRFGIARMFRTDGSVLAMDDPAMIVGVGEAAAWLPYEIVQGVAIIPIEGTLVAKLGSLTPWSGMTGYDGIRANLVSALENPEVRAVVLDIDSPGGEVAGCFDLVDMIHQARGPKPIHAILSECAYSAAYAIASAADRIVVPRTGGTGSVGVICMHVDFSKALAIGGIDVTLITYGERKADGAEVLPLSKAALARFQADIDTMGDLFVATVARNRGIKPETVRGTQASTYLGAAGVDIGFADAVAAPDQAFAELLALLK